MSEKLQINLDYQGWQPRRRWWRAGILLLIVLAILIGAKERTVAQWCEMRYGIYQCANYIPQHNTIGYFLPSNNESALAFYQSFSHGGLDPDDPTLNPDGNTQILSCWQNLISRIRPTVRPESVLFLHQLTSPAGHKRIVAVGSQYYPYLMCTVLKNDNFIGTPTICYRGRVFGDDTTFDPLLQAASLPSSIKIYRGSCNPSDGCRFVIPCELGGISAFLDGRLDDSDHISIQLRNAQDLAFVWKAAQQISEQRK